MAKRAAAPLRVLAMRLFGALMLLSVTAAHADGWLVAETTHLRVISNADESAVRTFARKLERFHALLLVAVPDIRPIADAPKLTIYVLRDRVSFLAAVPDAPRDLVGLYSADAEGAFAVAVASSARLRRRPLAPLAGGGNIDDLNADYDPPAVLPRALRFDADDYVLHEYTHHFLALHTGTTYPTWFAEGIAEFFATTNVDGAQARVGAASTTRTLTLSTTPWLDFDEVLAASPAALGMRKRASYYAQCWLLAHYLLSSPARWQGFRAYLDDSNSTGSNAERLASRLGIQPGRLRSELGRYATSARDGKELATRLPEPSIAVSALPAVANELVLRALRIRLGDRDSALLDEVRKVAAAHPDDAFAQLHVAEAELAAGDPRRAAELLAPYVAVADAPTQYIYLYGCAQLALAARAYAHKLPSREIEPPLERARSALQRVLAAVPEHPPSLFRLWQAATFRGMRPDADARARLLRAYELAPQVQEIALQAGVMLLTEQQTAGARAALQSIALHPHPGSLRSVARALLQRLDSPGSATPSVMETHAIIDAALRAPAGRAAEADDD